MQKHLLDLFISDEEKKVYNLITNGNVIKCFSSSLMLDLNKLPVNGKLLKICPIICWKGYMTTLEASA
jgi:hypothetical protein